MKVVLAHGNFDPLHVGHIRHLESARRLGDVLLVSVAPDSVCRLKGEHRPYFSVKDRVRAVNGLKCVTLAFESEPIDAIRLLRPDVYAKGPECQETPTERLQQECVEVQSYGGTVAYTSDNTYSSTDLMRKVLANG